jgi:hypothetical protein
MTKATGTGSRRALRTVGCASLILLMFFASYHPAVCLIGMFSPDPEPGRTLSFGISSPSGAHGSNPTPTRQQSRTDPETRSTLPSPGEGRGPDPRHTAERPSPVTSETAAFCLPVVIRLKAVTSQPSYLKPDAAVRLSPPLPPA